MLELQNGVSVTEPTVSEKASFLPRTPEKWAKIKPKIGIL